MLCASPRRQRIAAAHVYENEQYDSTRSCIYRRPIDIITIKQTQKNIYLLYKKKVKRRESERKEKSHQISLAIL